MLRIDKKTFTCDFIIDISNVEIRRSRKEKKFLKIYSSFSISYISYIFCKMELFRNFTYLSTRISNHPLSREFPEI